MSAPSPLRVVHVLTRLLAGGAEENTLATCAGQVRLGHEVHLLHGDEVDPSMRAKVPAGVHLRAVPTLRAPIAPPHDVRAVAALRAIYRELDPDVVHTHQSKAGVLGRLAVPGPGKSGRRPTVVHTVHIAPFVNVGKVQERLYVGLERLAARRTDRFISVSDGMREAYRRFGVGVDVPHAVVHSGMDLARYRDATAPDDWRARLGVGDDVARRPFTVLMLASFEPRKRQLELLEALAPWLRDTPDALLCLAGDGPCREDAERLVAREDIAARVRFLGHDARPEELIALADVCTLTSEREGLPRVLVQYVAARRTVLTMHLPGIEELLDDYEGATVVDDGNFTAFAAALRTLYVEQFAPGRTMPAHASPRLDSWDTDAMVEGIEREYRAGGAGGARRPHR